MWFYQAVSHLIKLPPALVDQIQYFCIDSRKAVHKSLFFALKGQKVDGHDYLDQAASNGAIVAVVDQDFVCENPPLFLVRVNDVKVTLQEMAKSLIAFWKPKIIAITGSLGKTSTKDFTLALTKPYVSIYGTPHSYNSQLTLPLTILNTPRPMDYLVLEMGLNQPGEIDVLLDIAPPTYAVLTALAHAHVEAFNDFENLALEKMKIFSRKSTQVGFYNQDIPFSSLAAQKAPKKQITYSLKDSSASFYLELKENQVSIFKDQKLFLHFNSPFFDYKSHYNLLAAVALADLLKVTPQQMLEQIPHLKHAQNRLEKVEKNGVVFICDAFNSTLDSVENALMSLPKGKSGRKIAILSDLVEQGQYNEENHIKMAEIALQYVDCLIGYGEHLHVMSSVWKKSKKKWAFFLSYSNMLAYISKTIQKGDVILVKGSRKRAMERILHDLTFS